MQKTQTEAEKKQLTLIIFSALVNFITQSPPLTPFLFDSCSWCTKPF
jgi:hypothetical protein